MISSRRPVIPWASFYLRTNSRLDDGLLPMQNESWIGLCKSSGRSWKWPFQMLLATNSLRLINPMTLRDIWRCWRLWGCDQGASILLLSYWCTFSFVYLPAWSFVFNKNIWPRSSLNRHVLEQSHCVGVQARLVDSDGIIREQIWRVVVETTDRQGGKGQIGRRSELWFHHPCKDWIRKPRVLDYSKH